MEVTASGTASITGTDLTNFDDEITDVGIYVLTCDLNAMAIADDITLSAYEKCLSAGTSRLVYQANYLHSQGAPIVKSPPINSAYGVTFKWQRTAGAATISVPWRIDSL